MKRVEQVPSLENGPRRSFIVISTNKVVIGLLGTASKGVMDATFKVKLFYGHINLRVKL